MKDSMPHPSTTVTWTPNSNGPGYTGVTNGGYSYALGSSINPSYGTNGAVGSDHDNWGNLTFTGQNGPVSSNIEIFKVHGDAEFDGDVKIKGKSLSELMERLEARLGVTHPNKELEERWEELRQLSVRYKELEAEIKEKEKMWAILNR
jgi:hypothetical protein